MPADPVNAWAALLRVHAALVPRLEQELLEARELPLSWYDVLLVLNSAPGRRMRMSELGERTVISRSRVSRVVDAMARAGLVDKQPNPDDRRSSFAALTPAGRQTLRAAAPTYLRGIEQHFSRHLSEHEVQVVTAALERVLAAQPGDLPDA